jgi:hypothetical protein
LGKLEPCGGHLCNDYGFINAVEGLDKFTPAALFGMVTNNAIH